MECLSFTSPFWSVGDKINFLSAVMEECPGGSLTLHSYDNHRFEGWRWSTQFLGKLLNSQIPLGSLLCSLEGSALSSLIHARCLNSNTANYDDRIICELIKRGLNVNDDTPLGKPFNHYLYMLSADLEHLNDKAKENSLLLVDYFLTQYDNVDSNTGMSLNPEVTEKMHQGASGIKVEEYMQTTLGSTLHFECPSQELYDRIKWTVDLSEVNGHRRNFVHHLAFLDDCFESNLRGLFNGRGYGDDALKQYIDLQDGDGLTPLMYATRNPKFFRQLLDCDADITLTDKRGFSVVHHLLIHGSDETIKVFLEWKEGVCISEECGEALKTKLDVYREDCLTLGVPFGEQLKELYKPRKIPVGHRDSQTPHLDILSTHRPFAIRFKEGLGLFLKEVAYERASLSSLESFEREREDVLLDQEARLFLSTGMASYLYDGPAFVTETYVLLDPFHICEIYGRYAPDFSYPLRAQSVLLDGFKRVFITSIKKKKEDEEWTVEGLRQKLRAHRRILIMSQDYLVPLLIQEVCGCDEDMVPFF